MEYCSWFSIEERDTVATGSRGALVRVEMRGWESHHPNGNYDRRAPRTGGGRNTSYVYCSKSKPAVLWQSADTRKWSVALLAPGHADELVGASISAYIQYLAVCHGLNVDEVSLEREMVGAGKRYGYTARPDAQEIADLDRPEDILKF